MTVVVIVDDDPAVTSVLCKLLTSLGHRALEAHNGEAALALCRSEKPDLIIADPQMPGMDGYQLVRQLRNGVGIAESRIIFFTGLPDARQVQELAEQLGVQQVLRKSSTTDEIVQAVNSALSAPSRKDVHPQTGVDRQHARVLSDSLLGNVNEPAILNSRITISEHQYREMFEGHPEPMWVLDARSLAFLSVNDAAILRYGYTREEFLARSILDIVPQEEVPATISRFQATEAGPASVVGVSRHYRKDGSLIEVELINHKLEFGGRPAYSVMAHDVTSRNRYEISLRESEEQLRQLAGRLQQVREEEMAFLARELHDDMGQSLTAIKMDLSWLAAHPDAAAEVLSARIVSAMDLADRTIEAARRLASQLRPGVLDLGLQAAIEWQAEEFRYHSDIPCELDLTPDVLPLNPGQEVTLFRIFQETLTNVARHSGASLVTIRLTVNGGQVVLAVQDNGRGITPVEISKRSSLGLLGVRERVLALGGSIEIEGRAGAGTLISVSVPVS